MGAFQIVVAYLIALTLFIPSPRSEEGKAVRQFGIHLVDITYCAALLFLLTKLTKIPAVMNMMMLYTTAGMAMVELLSISGLLAMAIAKVPFCMLVSMLMVTL